MTPQAHPLISVVIPCRNEKAHIADCIRTVLSQEGIPHDFEVLIADGMSDDGTREILENLARADQRLKIIDNPDRMTSRGINAGISQARGRYIAIMGAHNHYAPDYLRISLEVLEQRGADNVGGSMICQGQSWLQKAIAIAHHSRFSAGGARWHDAYYEGPADTVFGGFYRREVFEQVGLFDEALIRNQDDELNLRLTRAGGKIWQSPRIKSWYHPRASLSALFRQYMQYGYWKIRVVQKHRKPASLRHLVPGSFVFCLLVLPVVGLFYPLALWVWLGMVVQYLSCNFFASSATAARHGWRFLPILPLVFACYHFGYGIGFLYGFIDFVVLRRAPSDAFSTLTRSSAPRSRQSRENSYG
ncbi:MAG: glycosyltransferase family 2 protein [Candidatus Binatia bacterium]